MLQISFQKYDQAIEIDGRKVTLPCEIIFALPLDDRVIVMIDGYELPPGHPYKACNVFALDRNGKELWKIEETRHLYKAKDGKHYSLPWSEIVKKPDGSGYWIYSHSGYRFDFDPLTGKVAERGKYVH